MSLGLLIAVVVFLVALLTALGVVSGAHLLWWLLAGLALAIILGGVAIPWPVRQT